MQLLGNDLGRLQPAEPILTVRNYNPVSVRGQSSVPEFAQHPAIFFCVIQLVSTTPPSNLETLIEHHLPRGFGPTMLLHERTG